MVPQAGTQRQPGWSATPAKIPVLAAFRRPMATRVTTPTPLTYRDAGVDIDAGNEVVERIKPLVKRSFRPEVLGGGSAASARCSSSRASTRSRCWSRAPTAWAPS